MSVPLVYITDDGYVLPTAVSITSAALNKAPDTVYDIYVIGYQLSNGLDEAFTLLNAPGVRIHFLAYQTDRALENITSDAYVTSTALLKFKIPDLLPELNKVIYIDGDTLVQKDLTALYETPLDGKAVGAVKDHACIELFHDNMNLPTYFNSGVLLMDLAVWRRQNLGAQMMTYKQTHDGLHYMDQDVFNLVLEDAYQKLPVIYNAMMPNFRGYAVPMPDLNAFYGTDFTDYADILNKAAIIHITNTYKPWLYKDVYLSDMWLAYLKQSPFRDIQLSLRSPK